VTKIPTFALALLLGVPAATAALAGTATDNPRNIYQSESVADAAQPTYEQQVLKVRDILAAEGYGDVSDIARQVGGYTATVVKDDKVMEVFVESRSGKVYRLR
jgi:hypothetical protein